MAEVNISVEEIMKVLPHRPPFLLVDRIVELEEKKGVGIKNVTMDEWFFQGHFPGKPIMPGVLIIEALAQCAGFVAMRSLENPESKIVLFAGIENAKFRNPVVPGDQLRLEVEIVRMSGKIGKFRGVAKVGDKVAAEADMLAILADRE